MVTDLIDEIDSLASEEVCGHCGRQWHESLLTQRVAQMFDQGRLDPNYFACEDKSPVVCDGSALIGPRRPEPPPSGSGFVFVGTYEYLVTHSVSDWSTSSFTMTLTPMLQDALTFPAYIGPLKFYDFFDKPEEPPCPPGPDVVDVEFGPQNWIGPTEPVHAPPVVALKVRSLLPEFARIETHAPPSPGLDFSGYNEVEEPFYIKHSKKGNKHEGK